MKAAVSDRVEFARYQLLGLAPQAVQVVADHLSDSDPVVRRHAAREVLAQAVPTPRPGAEVAVVIAVEVSRSAAEVIRERLDALRESMLNPPTTGAQREAKVRDSEAIRGKAIGSADARSSAMRITVGASSRRKNAA